MGVVYRAHDEVLDRDVAVKFLLPRYIASVEAGARFMREARAVARLSHPNIMMLYDVGKERDWHYMVLEYIPGQSLREVTEQRVMPLPIQESLIMIQGVLGALAYAHEQGIIHRDIKPENLRLTCEGQVKVMDFGISLVQGETRLTETGSVIGTVAYLAPEIIQGQSPDIRSDLYAVGAVWYELLSGRPPFVGDTQDITLSQILHVAPPPLCQFHVDISPDIERIVLKLLQKAPEARYPSAKAVLADFPGFTGVQSIAGVSLSPVYNPGSAQDDGGQPRPMLTAMLPPYAIQDMLTEAIEAERRRLAELLQRDVLDTLNLLLTQVKAYTQTVRVTPNARVAFSVLDTLSRQAIQQVRDLEARLHPTVLENLGLEPALETFANQVTRVYGVQIALSLERLPERAPYPIELALFRVVQDAVEDAIRQAKATRIAMRLTRQEKGLVLRLADNGSFAGRAVHKENDTLDMYARIERLGGSVARGKDRQGWFEIKMQVSIVPPAQLTAREMDVLRLLAEGLSNKEIAQRLSISPRTVNYHLDNIYGKLGVNSRTEAVVYALNQGWL
ncbi:MAG: protein kinase [Anaerolineae bacterium]|nr:protein kinase [Anaerolineae bacterium]